MRSNPFPGLRPFEADEDHLFFGREKEIDELLRRLRTTRFLAVVGTSGSGKSSLVRSGLVPSLQSGFMAGTGSSWRIAMMRPAGDPIGNLASALSAHDVLGFDDQIAGAAGRVMIEATLRRGPLGLAQAARQARMPAGDNLIVIIDQFEELFRFRRGPGADSRDESIAFVRLLLEAAQQHETPVYLVLTMRSDFIGDCMDFPGLSEAVNAGLYLVGRMSRNALRRAITGPVAVAGAAVAPRLVNRILNDLGDDHDQLPLVQHALMRTWAHWERRGDPALEIDLDDYEAIGTMKEALSRHAEEAYAEAVQRGAGTIAERMFKRLTDTVSDARGIRRPTAVAELADVCGAPEPQVIGAIDTFRQAGRSFLTPPPRVALDGQSIVDVSHESLMRCWARLIGWADEERNAAAFYMRLSHAAAWHAQGSGGLWRNPELALAERWRRETLPTAQWARRYDEHFGQAIRFLDESVAAERKAAIDRERARRLTLRRVQATAVVLAVFLAAASAFGYLAWRERGRAEANLVLARNAVDESLSSADRDTARADADVPQVETLRRELLQKAAAFYGELLKQAPTDQASRRDAAFGHFRMGQIDRLMARPADAAREYQDAIDAFTRLSGSYPENAEYRSALGSAYNWLGETLRPDPTKSQAAAAAYDAAIRIQDPLAAGARGNSEYVSELARSHYNRGILLSAQAGRAPDAETDFRTAIRLLEPLAPADDHAAQELARAQNNLGSLLSADPARADDVRTLWDRAIAIDERLAVKTPSNREYKLELATYCSNLAALLNESGDTDDAARRSEEAVGLLDGLARVGPALAVARADAHDLHGLILAATDASAAAREYGEALDLFDRFHADQTLWALPDFHERFADLLLNLATLPRSAPDRPGGAALLTRAVAVYADACERIVAAGSVADAQDALANLPRVIANVPDGERPRLAAIETRLRRKIEESHR